MEARLNRYYEILTAINLSCESNEYRFFETEKLDAIKALLANSSYQLTENPIFLLYKHVNFNHTKPMILISCHIDSVCEAHFNRELNANEWVGSFDNSACNAATLLLMLENALNPQVVISFTGDEEESGNGAIQTARYFRSTPQAGFLDLVLTLDVTNLRYGHPLTIENLFVPEDLTQHQLKFKKPKFVKYLKTILTNTEFPSRNESWDDESLDYKKENLYCISVSLPIGPHPDVPKIDDEFFMEYEGGCLLRKDSIIPFMDATVQLSNTILQLNR